jgi:hypothetical protein
MMMMTSLAIWILEQLAPPIYPFAYDLLRDIAIDQVDHSCKSQINELLYRPHSSNSRRKHRGSQDGLGVRTR